MHGHAQPDENELWSYGPDAQNILVNFDRLRYRMLPYIYSLAWKTTSESYTPMRPLVMDFRADPRAENIGDQFMYRAGISGESGDRACRHDAATLSAGCQVVRLLDWHIDRQADA